MTRHPSRFELDAFAQGLMAPDVGAHVEACSLCKDALEETRALHTRFERSVLPRTVDRVVARRRWSIGRLPWLLAPALVFALVCWLAAPRMYPAMSERLEPAIPTRPLEDTRAELFAYAAASAPNATARRLGKDGVLHAGELVRLAVEETGLPYVAVLSIGPDGRVRVRAPIDGGDSVRVDAGHRELPGSILFSHDELPARLVAVFSPMPLASDELARTLQANAVLEHVVERSIRLTEVR